MCVPNKHLHSFVTHAGYALVVVTAVKQVATLKNEPVYEVAGCQIVTAPGAFSSRCAVDAYIKRAVVGSNCLT